MPLDSCKPSSKLHIFCWFGTRMNNFILWYIVIYNYLLFLCFIFNLQILFTFIYHSCILLNRLNFEHLPNFQVKLQNGLDETTMHICCCLLDYTEHLIILLSPILSFVVCSAPDFSLQTTCGLLVLLLLFYSYCILCSPFRELNQVLCGSIYHRQDQFKLTEFWLGPWL